MTRREQLYPEIRRLREDEGLKWREIGERLGVSLKTAHNYYTDPSGSDHFARNMLWRAKDNVAGRCAGCGAAIGGRTLRAGYANCASCRDARWATVRAEMVRLRRAGLGNREIAAQLGLSLASVANALSRERKRDPSIPRAPYMADRRKALAA